ncbi:MAG: DUF423 domain-containing protein [Thioalkalivibrionaceae bacterium]
MLTRPSLWLTLAGLLGFTAVALGAFGAHALAERFAAHPRASDWWNTAFQYQIVHTLALIGLVAVWARLSPNWANAAAIAWILGVIVFAGTLYAMALGAPKWLGAITPIGGTTLLAGWIFITIAAWRGA